MIGNWSEFPDFVDEEAEVVTVVGPTSDLEDRLAAFFGRDAELLQDPYVLYRELRERDPVYWSDRLGFWFITGYPEGQAVLRDDSSWSREARHASRSDPLTIPDGEPGAVARAAIERMLLMRDQPDHTRLRRLIARSFTPKAMRVLEESVRATVDEIMDDIATRCQFDVVADVAMKVPATVFASLLGLENRRSDFERWVYDFIKMMETDNTVDERIRCDRSVVEFSQYIAEQEEARRSQPKDDLLGILLAAEAESDRLSHDELLSNLMLLLAAGADTTAYVVSNASLVLARDRRTVEALRADRELWPAAVEESLRFDTSARNALPRWALTDVELGGARVSRGDKVIVSLAAANRDPRVFPNPDQFDVHRVNTTSHLSFGYGIHFCVGAALARMELLMTLRRLFGGPRDLTMLDPNPRWAPRQTLRGLEAMPVAWVGHE